MIRKMLAWLLDKKVIYLEVNSFYVNKKNNQLTFVVPTSLVGMLGEFEPTHAKVYFTQKKTFK